MTKKKLKNVTFVLGDKPCKTLRMDTGMWADTPPARKDGKVGKQHTSLVKFFR